MSILYQVALNQGIVKEGNYFLFPYPNGNNCLFRLVKREEMYVMWGPPTEGKITLKGKKGYDNFFALANAQVKKEYSFSEIFEEVHACGLHEKNYVVHYCEELQKIFDEAEKLYGHPDDANMIYFLASRFVNINTSYTYFNVFRVDNGYVRANLLYRSGGGSNSPTYAVRPEAIPKSTLLLETEGCDGSKEHPWICLGSKEGMQDIQSKTQETAILSSSVVGQSKAELMRLIQDEEEWIAKLKKYAENLK